ncbi:MAG: SpoIIE family protein phosphatase [Proteobacteria bacterium]|nr:SpoIIE family protein phosphatase [Pseudomonadota bacterium]
MNQIPSHSNLLQQLMDNMTDNIFFKDRNSKFIMINEATAKWLGFKNALEAVGKDDFDLFTEEFAETALKDEQNILETGEPLLCKEERGTWPDGRETWVSTTKIPLRDEDGQVVGIVGIGRDITDLKRKEFELQESNEKLSQANDQITEDLRMAAQLQKALLPQVYPSFVSKQGKELLEFHHYYEAASEIGGDFCSVYKLNKTKAGLLICDVMGHGVRAALVTGIIRTIAEDITPKLESPSDFLTAMNRQLHPILQTKDAFLFATACYLIIDTETGELTGALAGHTLPFLIQPRRGEASLLNIEKNKLGPALAITKDHEYQTFSAKMQPGDEILMYTDGICEVMNLSRDEFGVSQLQATIQDHNQLTLGELLPCIMQVVRNYGKSEHLDDDICLLGFMLNDLM